MDRCIAQQNDVPQDDIEQSRGDLIMRRANADEAPRVMEILEDGKRSIARFGILQWQQGYPNLDSVRHDIRMGSCYVAQEASGELVGTLALFFTADPEYKHAAVTWLTDAAGHRDAVPYASIHRCATSASALGKGVMRFLFTAAEDIARRQGKRSIRIDTHPGNLAMLRFLGRLGYAEIGSFDLATKHNGETDLGRIAYEKLI